MWTELDGAPTSAAHVVRCREQLWRDRLDDGQDDSDVVELDMLLRVRGAAVVEATKEAEAPLGERST